MKRGLLFLLFLCTSIFLFAQEPVRFGDREVYLEANVRPQKRGQKTSSLALGIPTGESLNVLVQFERGLSLMPNSGRKVLSWAITSAITPTTPK